MEQSHAAGPPLNGKPRNSIHSFKMRRYYRLTLRPRKALCLPARDPATMTVRIELPLEAVSHVVAFRVAGRTHRPGRTQAARSGTTDEIEIGMLIGTKTLERSAQLPYEPRVDAMIRKALPLDGDQLFADGR
jgi:hypothetical protein